MARARLSSRDLLGRLIAFDTTSKFSNLPLLDFVQDYLEGYGVACARMPDTSGQKANLQAVVGGDPKKPAVILSGHTDVVPAKAEDWTSNPFEMVERDGKLYGRGTTDMKGFLASALALVPDILEARLQTPVTLAFSYDEEVGCTGAPSLIERLLQDAPKAVFCIVGEPTDLVPVLAHKGKVAMRCHVYGVEAHSSMTHIGGNAIEAAACIICKIHEIAEDFRLGPSHDQGFTPSYTTLLTNLVSGGNATNIIPGYCCFDFEIRNIPDDDPCETLAEIKAFAEREVLAHLRARGDSARIEWQMSFSYPGLNVADNSEEARRIGRITGKKPGAKASYGTEAGLFQQAGIPTVICGPGSIKQAHIRDEFLEVSQLVACDQFLKTVIGDIQNTFA